MDKKKQGKYGEGIWNILIILTIILSFIFLAGFLYLINLAEIQDEKRANARFTLDIKTNEVIIRLDLEDIDECGAAQLIQQHFKDTSQIEYQIPITCE